MTEDTQSFIDRATAQPLPRAVGSTDTDSTRTITLGTEALLIGIGLALVIVFSGLLRLTALNWDDNHHLHPDERHITSTLNDTQVPSSIFEYFNTGSSPLNPYNAGKDSYVYGTVPLFLTKISGHVAGSLPFVGEYATYDGFTIVGRALAALFDIATVAMVFLLGRRLFGQRAGLLAALLYAFVPLAIQHAHFGVADPFITFFATTAVYYSVRIVQEGKWTDYAFAGAMVGLAIASKLTAVSLMPVVVLAAGIRSWPAIQAYFGTDATPATVEKSRTIGRAVQGSLLAVVVAFALFRIGQPYAFNAPGFDDLAVWRDDFACESHKCGLLTNVAGQVLDLSPRWVDDQTEQQALLSGGAWPPNVQWIGRTPWIYPLQQMIVWGMGPLFGVAGWLGMFYLAWRLFKRREPVMLIPIAWIAGYFLYMGGQFTLYLRYFLPLYPTLAVSAAALLLAIWGWAPQAKLPESLHRRISLPRELLPSVVRTAVVVVPVATILWGLAYFHIYSQPTTRNTASAWMYANIPEGSTIAVEHWDDSLPFNLADIGDASRYNIVTMNNYDLDTPEKVDALVKNLDDADVIALSSDRLSKTIPRVPANYPVTSVYYQKLFDGELGFDRKTFTVYPEVFGIAIPDRGAEEAWNVYDHPPVELFIKNDEYNHERAVAAIGADAFVDPVGLTPTNADRNALLFTPEELATQRAGGTFSDIFNEDSLSNRVPLITWLLVVEVIAFAVLPMTLLLFRGLPDRGYLLSKPIGFLVLGYIVWLGATLHVVQFSRGIIATAIVLMALLGATVAFATKDNLREFIRTRWRHIVLWEALFLGAFLLFYVIRLNNPDLWHPARGGEKPMDLAYLIAMTRAVHLPPPDPWFAGGYMNYYYFGQFLTAMLTKFTGIMPEVAYNLAVPLFFSLAVAATYSVGFNLAEATRRAVRWRPDRRRIGARGPVFAGLGAVLLVMLIGNLGGLQQLVTDFSEISPWHSSIPVVGGVVAFFGGLKAMIIDGQSVPLGTDFYWGPSRMMPPTISITEFPYFTFLFADLHAHLMAIPFAITSVGVGLALVLNAARFAKESVEYKRWASWVTVFLLALIVGALRWINSWDYPTFLLLGICAVFIAERAGAGRFDFTVLGSAVIKSVALVGLTMLFFWPFQAHYQLPATGFHQLEEREVTPFHQYAAHFGVFLFFIGAFMAFLTYRAVRRSGGSTILIRVSVLFAGLLVVGTLVAGAVGTIFDTLPMPFYIRDLTAGNFLRDVVGGILTALPGSPPVHSTDPLGVDHTTPVVAFAFFALALLGVLAWAGGKKRPRSDGSVMLYVFAMLALALFLSAGVEMVTLDFDIQRMNTVFKFYVHVWVLLAVVSAYAGWYLLDVVRPRMDLSVPVADLRKGKYTPAQLATGAFAVCAVGFVLAALVYTFVATQQRVQDRFDNPGAISARTDDGLLYMQGAEFGDEGTTIKLIDDYLGIKWMRDNVQGTPAIIEGNTPLYRWGGRYSIYTGLPAVVGWGWHQTQQREKYQELIRAREADVGNFYSSANVNDQQDILKKYDVEYVILGEVENIYYPGAGLQNIEGGLDGMLEKVFEAGQTSIYKVKPDPALAAAAP